MSWTALGSLAEWSRQPKIAILGSLKISIFGVLGGPGEVKIGPQRPLEPVLEPLQLLEASCTAFGGLLGRSWGPSGPPKVLLNGSWPLQDDFQDRFQPSWGPKGSRKGGQEGPKSRPRGDWSSKHDFFKKHFFFIELIDCSGPGVAFGGSKSI